MSMLHCVKFRGAAFFFVALLAQLAPNSAIAESNTSSRPIVVFGDFDLNCEKKPDGLSDVGAGADLAHKYIDAIAAGDSENLRKILADDGTREEYRGAISSPSSLLSAYRNVKNIRCVYSVRFEKITLYRMQKTLLIKSKDKVVELPKYFLLASICGRDSCRLTNRFYDAYAVDAMFGLYEQEIIGFGGKSLPKGGHVKGWPIGVLGNFPIFDVSVFANGSIPIRINVDAVVLGKSTSTSVRTAAKENGKSYFRYQGEMGVPAQTVPGFRLFSQEIRAEALDQFGALAFSPKKAGQAIGVFKVNNSELVQFLPVRCSADGCQLEGIEFEDPVWAFLNQVIQIDPAARVKR